MICPDRSTPFLNPDNTISIAWFMYIATIAQAVGGDSVVPGGGIAPIDISKQFEEYAMPGLEGVEALRAVDELRNTMTTGNDANGIRTALDELTNAIAEIRLVTDLRSRVESLEDRLA